MKKKIIYISVILLVFVFLSALSAFVASQKNKDLTYFGNLDAEGMGNFYNDLKEDCSAVVANNGKYQNNILNLEFDYPENIIVCERYPFNNKKIGSEIDIWNKSDFESTKPANGPVAAIYVNEILSLDTYLKNLYNQDGFANFRQLLNGKNILMKDGTKKTCQQESCKFKIYKIETEENPVLIIEYKNIDSILNSLNPIS